MLTPREVTEAPTQGSRSPLSTTEVTELATVRLFLILSALRCSLRPGFCIVCDFAHARPIMLQHSTSKFFQAFCLRFSSPAFNYYAQRARRGGGRRPGNEATIYIDRQTGGALNSQGGAHLAWVPGLPRSVRVLIMRRRQTFENRGRPGLKYHVR